MISPIQIILLTAYSVLTIYDGLNTRLFLNKPVVAGMIAGIIMGDMATGLAIGGTLQLMVLGVSSFGGATIPNYETAAIIATALGVATGNDVETSVGLAIPIALLLVQLDIFSRFLNTFLQKRADVCIEKGDFKQFELLNYLGIVSWGLSRGLPVVVGLAFGTDLVNNLVAVLPDWFLGGIKLSGSILPIVGIAVLLKYLPVKDFFAYLVVGFVLYAYLGMDMLGVSLIGLAFALVEYKRRNSQAAAVQMAGAGAEIDGGEMGDE